MGISTTQINDFYVQNSWRIYGGFLLCFLGGLSRSSGFTKYRTIKVSRKNKRIKLKGLRKRFEIKKLIRIDF